MEETPFDLAVKTLGGADALSSLQTLTLTGQGSNFIDYSAHMPAETEATNTYTTAYSFDFDNDSQRHDVTRTLLFGALQFIGEHEFSMILDGRVGVLTADAGFATAGDIP